VMSHDAGMIPLEMYHFSLASTRAPRARTISWTAETVEDVVPDLSVSRTEMTKVPSQYSSVMV